MNVKFISYVDELFERLPAGKKSQELKEEVIAGLDERYTELRASGYDDKRAYDAAILGLGDVQELIEDILRKMESRTEYPHKSYPREFERPVNKKLRVTIAVGLFIIAAFVFLGMLFSREFIAGFCMALVLCGIATLLMITCYAPYSKRQNLALACSVLCFFFAVFMFFIFLYEEGFGAGCAALLTTANIGVFILILNFSPYHGKKRLACAFAVSLFIEAAAVFCGYVFNSFSYYYSDFAAIMILCGIMVSAGVCILVYSFGFGSEEYASAKGKKRRTYKAAHKAKRREFIDSRTTRADSETDMRRN